MTFVSSRNRGREALGTAVWVDQVGDALVEQQGHAMIDEAPVDG